MNDNKAAYPVRADHLRGLRIRRFLTQEELAEKSGVSLGRIKQIEQGGGNAVRAHTLRKLADALSCTPNELSEQEVAS